MEVGRYVALVHRSEQALADALDRIAEHHQDEPDVDRICHLLASWSRGQVEGLRPIEQRYAEQGETEPDALMQTLFNGPREGPLALVRDLQDVWLLTSEAKMSYTVLAQAAKALRDDALETCCVSGQETTRRQLAWLETRLKMAAPQALVVA